MKGSGFITGGIDVGGGGPDPATVSAKGLGVSRIGVEFFFFVFVFWQNKILGFVPTGGRRERSERWWGVKG